MRISVTQQRIVKLAAEGLSDKEIAARLYLSISTVKHHLGCLYRDLGMFGWGSRFQMLKFCSFIGLVKI